MWAMTAEWFLEPPIKIIFTFSCSWKMNVANYSGIKKLLSTLLRHIKRQHSAKWNFIEWEDVDTFYHGMYHLSQYWKHFCQLLTFKQELILWSLRGSWIMYYDTSMIIKMWFK